MSTHKSLRVELGRRGCWSATRGRDAYTLLVAVGARPIWSALSKAWMSSYEHGRSVIALAEARNYLVDVTEARPTVPVVVTPVTAPEPADDGDRDLFGEAIA